MRFAVWLAVQSTVLVPADGCIAADRIHVWIQAYIPNLVGKSSAFVQTATQPAIKAPVGGSCYAVDASNTGASPTASARLTTEFDVVIDGREMRVEPHALRLMNRVGETHKVDCTSGATLETRRASDEGMSIGEVKKDRLQRSVFAKASVANPFMLTSVPSIDYSLSVRYDVVARVVELRGSHDGFPAYAGWYSRNGAPAIQFIQYIPKDSGPLSLIDFWSGLNASNFEVSVRL